MDKGEVSQPSTSTMLASIAAINTNGCFPRFIANKPPLFTPRPSIDVTASYLPQHLLDERTELAGTTAVVIPHRQQRLGAVTGVSNSLGRVASSSPAPWDRVREATAAAEKVEVELGGERGGGGKRKSPEQTTQGKAMQGEGKARGSNIRNKLTAESKLKLKLVNEEAFY